MDRRWRLDVVFLKVPESRPKVVVAVLERDARCMMITLDPDTGEKDPAILKKVAQAHDGMAGVYGAVMVEGMLHKGDPVEVLD